MEILGVDFCIIGRNEKYLLARKPVSPKCEDLPGQPTVEIHRPPPCPHPEAIHNNQQPGESEGVSQQLQ